MSFTTALMCCKSLKCTLKMLKKCLNLTFGPCRNSQAMLALVAKVLRTQVQVKIKFQSNDGLMTLLIDDLLKLKSHIFL